jgi:hypothetical protein
MAAASEATRLMKESLKDILQCELRVSKCQNLWKGVDATVTIT